MLGTALRRLDVVKQLLGKGADPTGTFNSVRKTLNNCLVPNFLRRKVSRRFTWHVTQMTWSFCNGGWRFSLMRIGQTFCHARMQ